MPTYECVKQKVLGSGDMENTMRGRGGPFSKSNGPHSSLRLLGLPGSAGGGPDPHVAPPPMLGPVLPSLGVAEPLSGRRPPGDGPPSLLKHPLLPLDPQQIELTYGLQGTDTRSRRRRAVPGVRPCVDHRHPEPSVSIKAVRRVGSVGEITRTSIVENGLNTEVCD